MIYRPHIWKYEGDQDAHVHAWRSHVAIMEGFREMLKECRHPRFEKVSRPDAVIEATQINLTPRERRDLTISKNIFRI